MFGIWQLQAHAEGAARRIDHTIDQGALSRACMIFVDLWQDFSRHDGAD